MRVYSRVCFDMTGEKIVAVASNSRLYLGPIDYCKGASSQQKQLEAQQAAFSQQLQTQYQQQFGNQTAVFNAIKAVYDPILSAGPNQYGFSTAQDTALRTLASEGTAGNYAAARKATAETLAARGGGNSFLPSGAEAEIQAGLTGQAAESESTKQLDITNAGYETGRQNFNNATNAELAVASGYNPLGYAGAATNTNQSAFNEATKIQELNNAASPWGVIGGLAGGLAGSILGPVGSQIGSKLGGFLGSAGSSNSSSASSTNAGLVPWNL